MRAGFVLAREGALSMVDSAALPPVMRPASASAGCSSGATVRKRSGRVERLTRALTGSARPM
jgi:ubiquinone biosynthesis protein